MPSPLQQAGALSAPSKFAPLHVSRFFTGQWTQRSLLREAAVPFLYEKFYAGARFDSVLGGLNAELTARLTWARRAGHSVYNAQTFPAINRFYPFRQFGTDSESIRVMADTASAVYDATGPSTKALIWTKSAGAGSTYFQGVGNTLYMGNGVDQVKWSTTKLLWVAATAFQLGQWIIDGNGNIQQVTAVTGDGKTGGSQPAWGIDPRATITDNNVTWTCRGGAVAGWGMDAPAAAPMLAAPDGFALRFWAASYEFPTTVPYTLRDGNGNVQEMISQASASGTEYPSFATTGNTTDGGAIWKNLGQMGVWMPNTMYPSSATIIDPNGNLQMASVAQNAQAKGDVSGYYIPATYSESRYTFVVIAYFSDGTHTGPSNPIVVSGKHFTLCWNAVPNADHYCIWCTSADVRDDHAVTTTGKIQGAGSRNAGSGPNFPPTTTSIYMDNGDYYCYGGDGSTPPATNTTLLVTSPYQVSGLSQPQWSVTLGGETVDSNGTQPAITWTNLGTAQVCVFKGYTYAFAFHTVTGHVSTASPTLFTGPVFGQSYTGILSGAGSDNPQVDKIWIFRTTDGGSALLFLDEVDNPGTAGTWRFTDQHPDSDLNSFLPAPIAHENDAPPKGLAALAYYRERVWGAVGNVVNYSGGPDTLTGSGDEAWPPNNYFTLPSRVIRLWPTAIGLIVLTAADIYVISGTGTAANPFRIDPFMDGIGLAGYDAFCVNGSTAQFWSSDGRLLALDPGAGCVEPGFPIGDLLPDFGPMDVTWHQGGNGETSLFVADRSTGWYRMSIVSPPENGYAWSTRATLNGGCSAIRSLETEPGKRKLLAGPKTSGPILFRDPAVRTDNGSAYAWNLDVGSIVLAQPGQLAEIPFVTIDSLRVGSRPILGVLLGEIRGTFESLTYSWQDPPQLPAAASLYNDRYYMCQSQQPTFCRHLQLRFSWPEEDVASELLTYTIFGAVHQERHS